MVGCSRKGYKTVSGSEGVMENGSKQTAMERITIGAQGSTSTCSTLENEEEKKSILMHNIYHILLSVYDEKHLLVMYKRLFFNPNLCFWQISFCNDSLCVDI